MESLRKSTTPLATEALKVQTYLKECFRTCWLMSVQDPPVVLGTEVSPGLPLDDKLYKAYTKSGPVVEYVVWPPLHLHSGGALLSKGVAQGREKEQKSAVQEQAKEQKVVERGREKEQKSAVQEQAKEQKDVERGREREKKTVNHVPRSDLKNQEEGNNKTAKYNLESV